MNLTRFTDYSLRVLIFVALREDVGDAGDPEDDRVSVGQVSEAFDVSRNHLVKIVQHLGQHGFLETQRGRRGGIRLGRPADQIQVGDVVRCTEPTTDLLDCFAPGHDECRIVRACVLKSALRDANRAFFDVLQGVTLADLVKPRRALQKMLAV